MKKNFFALTNMFFIISSFAADPDPSQNNYKIPVVESRPGKFKPFDRERYEHAWGCAYALQMGLLREDTNGNILERMKTFNCPLMTEVPLEPFSLALDQRLYGYSTINSFIENVNYKIPLKKLQINGADYDFRIIRTFTKSFVKRLSPYQQGYFKMKSDLFPVCQKEIHLDPLLNQIAVSHPLVLGIADMQYNVNKHKDYALRKIHYQFSRIRESLSLSFDASAYILNLLIASNTDLCNEINDTFLFIAEDVTKICDTEKKLQGNSKPFNKTSIKSENEKMYSKIETMMAKFSRFSSLIYLNLPVEKILRIAQLKPKNEFDSNRITFLLLDQRGLVLEAIEKPKVDLLKESNSTNTSSNSSMNTSITAELDSLEAPSPMDDSQQGSSSDSEEGDATTEEKITPPGRKLSILEKRKQLKVLRKANQIKAKEWSRKLHAEKLKYTDLSTNYDLTSDIGWMAQLVNPTITLKYSDIAGKLGQFVKVENEDGSRRYFLIKDTPKGKPMACFFHQPHPDEAVHIEKWRKSIVDALKEAGYYYVG